MTLKVALYIRTSTEYQMESIKLQTEELISYSKSHNCEIYERAHPKTNFISTSIRVSESFY